MTTKTTKCNHDWQRIDHKMVHRICRKCPAVSYKDEDDIVTTSIYEEVLSDENKRIKYQQSAVFNWFCNNGYVPPVNSEINDLINVVEGWSKK